VVLGRDPEVLQVVPTTIVGYDAEAAEIPIALTAVTLKKYEDPVVRPVIVQVRAPAVVHEAPPGEAVAVYPVTASPLAEAADQVTAAEVSEATLEPTPVGADGTVAGTIAADADEPDEVPRALVAVMENV
jgi:hypothetical protein